MAFEIIFNGTNKTELPKDAIDQTAWNKLYNPHAFSFGLYAYQLVLYTDAHHANTDIPRIARALLHCTTQISKDYERTFTEQICTALWMLYEESLNEFGTFEAFDEGITFLREVILEEKEIDTGLEVPKQESLSKWPEGVVPTVSTNFSAN